MAGDYECEGTECRASRTSCTTLPNYSTSTGDFVGTVNGGDVVASDGRVTRESVTVNTEEGTQESNGYECITVGPGGSTATTTTAGAAPAGPDAPEPVVITVTQRDFASLPVAPLDASAGPPDGWLPVNMVNVLHADPDVQTLETELLDTPVEVRAIPIEYHWDLGDGSTITTTSPGDAYPSEEITATYRYEGWYDVTLTTTFSGQYRVDGGDWEDIDGTIEVTSDPIEIYSKSLTSRLTDPYSDTQDGEPASGDDEPWIPERTAETEGPRDPDATHRDET